MLPHLERLERRRAPFGVDLDEARCEFETSHAAEIMVGKYNNFSNPHFRTGGYSNYINCGQSSGVLFGDVDTNATIKIIGGDIDSSGGANVYFDGVQASLIGVSVFDGSNTNGNGKPYLLGPNGANGTCAGVDFSPSANHNGAIGNVIGNSVHSTWQAEAGLIENGAQYNTFADNVLAGNVIQQGVNQGDTTNVIGPNSGSTGAILLPNQVQFPITTLTDASTIAWATNQAQVAKVTIAASRTMGAPTNLVAGGTYDLYVIQGGSGNYGMTWNAAFKWPGGAAPALSTSVGAVDLISCISLDGSTLDCVAQTGFQ